MRRTGYLLQEAWSSLRIHRTSVIISVLTLACTMTSFGIFALLYLNVKQFAGALQNEFQVVVYLAPDASSTTVTGLRRRLKGEPAVATLSYISKQQALEDFHRQFPQEASLLDGLGENPLPASFVVTLAPPFQSPQAVEAFVKRVQAFPGVDEVRYSQAWIDMLAVFVSYLELSALIIGGVLMVATMAIIANTVRLALYARKEEVEILRLIGATGSFIA
ncbi:MAG: ABC transporter permease, partial [Nitrospirae bacterium]